MVSVVIATLIGLTVRVAIIFRAGNTGVDDYYWQQVAKGFRQSRQLPLKLPGKYLMEDERQFYPPLYGLLLSFLPSRLWRWGGFTALIMELGTLGVLIAWLVASGLGAEISLTIVILGYLIAPVLVAYNSQLNSRLLGQLFLVVWVLALNPEIILVNEIIRFGIASFAFAMIVLSHKMTLQLAIILIVPLGITQGSLATIGTSIAGIIFAALMVGPKFFSSQIRAHYDIISFWSRNVGNHSAHPIHHSPIYGKTEARFQQTLYGKGWKGLMKHVKLLISYVPGVWPLIALLALGQLGVPSWLVVWLAGTYLWAFGTMFIPPLRCFGPGYLYLYNAVPPVMLSWVYIYEPTNDLTVWGLYVALALTLLVFPFVWFKTGQRPRTVDDDLEALFEQLKDKPKMNMAVFPLQVAEPVACLTKHAVLWGAHGLGFAKLEGWFPVIKLKISEVFAKWEIDAVLWDAHWAPSLEEILHKESLIDGEVQQQGRWRLAQCNTGKIS